MVGIPCPHCMVPDVNVRIQLRGEDASQEILQLTLLTMEGVSFEIGGVIGSDSALTIKGLIETTEGTPRVHQHLATKMGGGLLILKDYTKLETIWQRLRENNGEVLMRRRMNGYAQTSRTMTSQGRAAQEITRMEEHNRRIPYTATRNRNGPQPARRHIFTAEEWEQIDEEYWIDEEVRLGKERILRIDERIEETANGNLGMRSRLYRQLLSDPASRELDRRQCIHGTDEVFHLVMRRVIENCYLPTRGSTRP
jgi:hypothetical protein